MSGEISSLKPELRPKVKPNFIWENKGYESYINNGFRPPDPESQVPGYWENKFLSEVDLSKGKIKVKVQTMIRQLAPDWSTEREDRKEYLTFNTDWSAKNYLGVNIFVRGHIEGVFMDQQRELVTKTDPRTGEETAYYRKATPRETFYIPFNKKKVEQILGEHPFGPNSVNITDKDRVLYYGKFRYAAPPFRASCFNYEEFTNWTFNQMLDKASKTKSPYADDIEKMMKKFSHIA